jgi:hypothetical protein
MLFMRRDKVLTFEWKLLAKIAFQIEERNIVYAVWRFNLFLIVG